MPPGLALLAVTLQGFRVSSTTAVRSVKCSPSIMTFLQSSWQMARYINKKTKKNKKKGLGPFSVL